MAENQSEKVTSKGEPATGNLPLSKPGHALSSNNVVEELHTDVICGLTHAAAAERLQQNGQNTLGDEKGVNPWSILLRQVLNAMTLVLVLAMAVSFGIRSWIEGGIVAAVVFLNITVGFWQELNAEKKMDSLRSLGSPTASAVRESDTIVIPTREVVPGDIIEIKVGETVPADMRLIEGINLETDEALLTGEPYPVKKDCDTILDRDTGPGDRINVVFSSSTVTKGRGKGVVFATGMHTEIGSIATALRTKDTRIRPVKRNAHGTAGPHRYAQAWTLTFSDAVGRFLGVNVGTPLQKKLSRLAVLLLVLAVIFAIIVLAANRFSNRQEIIIYAVTTGLSIIPASLIVVLTISMAAGTSRMVERHVIVRNLRSLEALGGVTDICSDKTGTITQGKMVVKTAWIPGYGTCMVEGSDEPFNPNAGTVFKNAASPKANAKPEDKSTSPVEVTASTLASSLQNLVRIAGLANSSTVSQDNSGRWHARGDPTEVAAHVFASRLGWKQSQKEKAPVWKTLAEFPFDSDVKKMSVLSQEIDTSRRFIFTKGAVERVLMSCTHIHDPDVESAERELTDEDERNIIENMEAMASNGLRVLAFAHRQFASSDPNFKAETPREEFEKHLTFIGLMGLYDPPREESLHAIRECRSAGIEVHMLTGDHPGTAQAIAKEVGILPENTMTLSKSAADCLVMTASAFDKLSAEQIDEMESLPLVIARCTPRTKVRMIEALHRRRKFAAMTGDGVNDAPALKHADIGIAMGQAGSDVAKDASDIVLSDDNFASIVNAVEEGRRMFDNIQKFTLHLLAQNVAQALILLIGLAFKDTQGLSVFPLGPVEIMWIIMITSSLPDMALGFEAAQPSIMERPPHNIKRGIFTLEVMLDMCVYGIWIAALCLASFSLVLYGFGNGDLGENCNDDYSRRCDTVFRARATCFACLTWLSLFLAWELVNLRRSFFWSQDVSLSSWFRRYSSNKYLFGSVLVGFVTIFATLYIPVINRQVFKHEGISWEWGVVFIATGFFFLGIETWKFGKRVYFRHKQSLALQRQVVSKA